MKTPLLIFVFALAVVLFACASPAVAMTIESGVTYTVASGVNLSIGIGETLTINPGGILIVEYGGIIDNDDGNIYNNGTIYNYGTINNYEGGIIIGSVTGNTATDYSNQSCPFICLCEEVEELPAFTPVGIVALIGLLSAIAAITITRRKRS